MADKPVGSEGSRQRPPLPPEGRADFLDDHPFEVETYPLGDAVLVEDVRIPMRDGIYLGATVYRPASGAVVPAITTATPYGKDQFHQTDNFRDAPQGSVPGGGGFYLGRVRFSDRTPFEAPDPGFWVPHEYAVVIVDLPGWGKSQSNPAGTPGPESRWHDVMSWIAQQLWCTGDIGMSGVSALCATQWIAAKDPAPPQLKAIIAWEGINESGPGGGYGGIPETAFTEWMETVWQGPNVNPDSEVPEPYIRDWKFDTSAIGVPALVCASFSDQELHTWDSFDAFTRLRSDHKWLFGHRRQKWGAYYGTNELQLQKNFLDRFLKGRPDAMDGVPRVRLEINEDRFSYKVIEARSWPVQDTRYRDLYLDASAATLCLSAPDREGSTGFAAEECASVNRAVFDYTFSEANDIVGHMALTLFVEVEGADDLDLFVGIEKLDREGNEVYFFSASGGNANGPVSRGWLRASNRTLDAQRSLPWRPVLARGESRPLQSGEIAEVHIAIMPSGTTFHPGERLRLVLQSWSLPGQFEGGETRRWATIGRGYCRIHTGGRYPSRLLFPIVKS